MSNREAGPTATSYFATQFLGSVRIGSTNGQATRGAARTPAECTTYSTNETEPYETSPQASRSYLQGAHAAITHDLSKKAGALVDPNLSRISAESVFVSHVPTSDIMSAADAVITSQAGYFETEKCVGTVLFPIGAGFDRNRGAGTASGEALETFTNKTAS